MIRISCFGFWASGVRVLDLEFRVERIQVWGSLESLRGQGRVNKSKGQSTGQCDSSRIPASILHILFRVYG